MSTLTYRRAGDKGNFQLSLCPVSQSSKHPRKPAAAKRPIVFSPWNLSAPTGTLAPQADWEFWLTPPTAQNPLKVLCHSTAIKDKATGSLNEEELLLSGHQQKKSSF